MAKMNLVRESDDRGYFFVAVESGNVTVGDHTGHPEAVLRGLRILHVRCEVEVEQELVVVMPHSGETGELTGPRRLGPGQGVNVGHARVRLEPAGGRSSPPASSGTLADIRGLVDDEPGTPARAPAASAPVAPAPPTPPPGSNMVLRLKVIDGADQGVIFRLPDSGRTSIGKSHKHADIVLHDLYVSRVHCEVNVQGDKIMVTHVEGANGTLINGRVITQPTELRPNEILRVGNTQMRLEWGSAADSGEEEKKKAAEEE